MEFCIEPNAEIISVDGTMGQHVAVLATSSGFYHRIWLEVFVEPVPICISPDIFLRGVGRMKWSA